VEGVMREIERKLKKKGAGAKHLLPKTTELSSRTVYPEPGYVGRKRR